MNKTLPCQVFVRMECPIQRGLSLLTASDRRREIHPNSIVLCPSAYDENEVSSVAE